MRPCATRYKELGTVTMTAVDISIKAANSEDIGSWRERYRSEMNCQIIHDSIHGRAGWSQEYLLETGASCIGYGSVAVGGPWADKPTVYEFYVAPEQRARVAALFEALLQCCGAIAIEVQSNDILAATMLHAFAHDVRTESVLFQDAILTAHQPRDAVFREAFEYEIPDISDEQVPWHGVVEVGGRVVARGGVLFHYNPPYGDIYMEVDEPFRRRGYGTFLVQELKKLCYAAGKIPGARCNPANIASLGTLQRAGFIPCGHMLAGRVSH